MPVPYCSHSIRAGGYGVGVAVGVAVGVVVGVAVGVAVAVDVAVDVAVAVDVGLVLVSVSAWAWKRFQSRHSHLSFGRW